MAKHDLKGKVVVITGASSGFGKGTALELARAQAHRQVQAPEPLHDPQDVIDALVGLARNPRDQKIVGADGIAKIFLKNVAPRTEEKLGARQIHKAQMQDAPAAPQTDGAVLAPIPAGTAIRGGRLEQRH